MALRRLRPGGVAFRRRGLQHRRQREPPALLHGIRTTRTGLPARHQPSGQDKNQLRRPGQRVCDATRRPRERRPGAAQRHRKDRIRRDVSTDQQHPHDGRPSRHFRLRRQRRAIDQVSLGPGRLRSNQNDPRPLRARRSRPQRRSLLKRHNRIGSDRIDAAGHQRVAGRVRLRSCLGAAAVNENYDPTLDSGIGQLERLGWA